VMKQLLLLTFLAVASEAMAQDTQCVPERAAMVKTIRAYARSEADVLGPRGISERVLQVMEQTERHRFIPGRSCSAAYVDYAASSRAPRGQLPHWNRGLILRQQTSQAPRA
jgi:protein-L-isoaspartate(D-aspartate) O-methyltransferase